MHASYFWYMALISRKLGLIGLNDVYKYVHLIASIHFLLVKLEPTDTFYWNFRDMAIWQSLFVIPFMRCPFIHEYLMISTSISKTNVRNEFLDLENIHVHHIRFIWCQLKPKRQGVIISWIINLWAVTPLSWTQILTR